MGFLAAVLLAVVGWLGGALPHGDVASTPVTIARQPYGLVVLCGWLVGTVLLAYAWWAVRDRIPSARWAFWTALLWTIPFLVVPAMGSRDLYSYACQGFLFGHGVNPYEAGVDALPCPWIDAVSPIWRETAAPYGPLFVLISGGVMRASGNSLVAVVLLFRLVAVVGMALVAAGLPVIARRCGVPVGRALWLGLAGPLIGAYVIAGPHNDALMVGLLVAGLAVAALRRGPLIAGTAGVLLGLAVAVKVTAIVVVPFAVLIVCARPYRWRQAARDGGAVAVGVLGSMGLVTVVSGLGFGWIAGLVNTKDLVQFTSPPTAIGMTVTYVGQLFDPSFDAVPTVRILAAVLLIALCALLLWRSAVARDAVPAGLRCAALALAATVALSPYFHPWYALWPLALMAATTLRTSLVMAAATAGPLLVLPDGGGLARFVKFPGAPLMTILLVVLLVRYFRGTEPDSTLAPIREGARRLVRFSPWAAGRRAPAPSVER